MLWLWAGVALAGPWTRPSGGYYAKAGGDWYVPTEFVQVGRGGGEAAEDTYFGHQYSLYGELGLPGPLPLQIGLKLPLSVSRVGFTRVDNGQSATGTAVTTRMGDLALRAQVGLLGDRPLALAVDAKLPMYSNDGICSGYPQFRGVCARPGDGQVDLSGWLLGGAALGERGWAELGLGYRHRTEWYLGWDTPLAWGDSALIDTLVGLKAGPALLMAKLNGNLVLSDPGLTEQALKLGPAVLVDVAPGLGLEARVEQTLWAQHTSKGVGFGVGISHRR